VTKTTPPADSLKSVAWKRFIAAGDATLLDDLYVPALSRAVHYDRCCAYFSSQVLAVAARGFGGFIQNLLNRADDIPKPAARLLVNEQLERRDLEHLQATGDQSHLIEHLLKQFKSPVTALEKNRLQMLAWLVASGWLEVRVGVMRHSSGILHAKFGIVTDRHGDRLAFMGSDNETGQAITENYEVLNLAGSWQDTEYVDHHSQLFDRLWDGREAAVLTLALPEAVRRKLISFAPEQPPGELLGDRQALATAMLWRYIAAAAYLPDGEYACDATAPVELWPHQRRVVEDTARAFPDGRLLCDEVGMGKTIEAILVLRRLLAGRGVKRALLLVPAGLLQQWQDELREKGGLVVPRWENQVLYWPDGRKQTLEAAQALAQQEVLLLSREWARTEGNRNVVLTAPGWDLVLLDEAHAARRSAPVETEFNSVNLLLQLLRELQLRGRARAIHLLSATPMQLYPWEPWDLLAVLGVGAAWMVEFDDIRRYYEGIEALRQGALSPATAMHLARLVTADSAFPPPPANLPAGSAGQLVQALDFLSPGEREAVAGWLRHGSPLARHMHRNTRDTLKKYYQRGLLPQPPPSRRVRDKQFDYQEQAERDCYEAIQAYIDDRFAQLEKEKPGKGFVMTIYRRRATSSPYALRCSLERRLAALNRVIVNQWPDTMWAAEGEEHETWRDLADAGEEEQVDPGLPKDPKRAEQERNQVEGLLRRLEALGTTDSKLDHFFAVLKEATADGRAALVFTVYVDTMTYVRDALRPTYGITLGCYSGRGGELWDGKGWVKVTKAEVSARLESGQLRVLVCDDAASEGLNLQAASALINYDLPWNPSRVEQRIGRIDRIGQQQREVLIYNLFVKDSVDMRVYELLQQRCGLFERFIGAMQPILAKARDVLRGKVPAENTATFLKQLAEEAERVKGDATIASVFADSEVEAVPAAAPPATRQDILTALTHLENHTGKLRAKHHKSQGYWTVTGLGSAAIKVTTDRETLERNDEVVPLSAGSPVVEQLARKLDITSRAPLVLGEHLTGPYRCIEARWVQGDGSIPVRSAGQLTQLLEAWDGAAPSPGQVLQAQVKAEQEARERVNQMRDRAGHRQAANLQRQLDAARRRLMRELGRTLRCMGDGDLDSLFHKQVQREPSQDGRYHHALRLLGGYPTWTGEDLADANAFVQEAKGKDLNARRAGSEIDAAIGDPRWLAKQAAKSRS